MTQHPETNRHDNDGQPYIAYYRADLVIGFIWDGNPAHHIQVTREMGEPVIDSFRPHDWCTTPASFKNECDNWLAT